MVDNLNIIKNELQEVKKIRATDSKWSHNRRIVVIFLICILLSSYVGVKIYGSLQVAPTCADDIKNGLENGVDCGGECALICKSEYKPLTIEYSNYFANADGTYDIITLIQNDNSKSAPREVTLTYELYDDMGGRADDIVITVPASHGNVVPVITNNYKVATRVAKISTKISDYKMYKNEKNYNLRLKDFEFEKGSISKLRVNYESLSNIKERIVLLVLLKDSLGNIINYATQNIEDLNPGGNYTSYFSWSEEIDSDIATVTLIPIYH